MTDLEIQIQELKQMRMQMEVNRKEFTDYFGIPIRTVEDWEAGKRRMPVYDDKGELIRYNIFKMRMLVRHDKDEKLYLYDFVRTKKETSSPIDIGVARS